MGPFSTPYKYDPVNPPYLSRILTTVFLVQSPIPPGQLSPELVPHKFPIELLQNGLAALKLELTAASHQASVPVLGTEKETNSDECRQVDITNEQLTIDQLGQLPENTPTVMSREEFEAFFRILDCARKSDVQVPENPNQEKASIEVIPSSSTQSAKRPRSSTSMTPQTDKKARRTTATFAQKIKILNWFHAHGQSQTGTAKHFDPIYPELRIKQPLISAWVKDESYIRSMAPPGSTTAKRVRNTTHPQVTAMLEEWVQQAIVAKVNITGEVICEKWKHFAQLCGIPSAEWLSLSHGWLDAFRQRNGLRHFKQAAQLSANAAKQPEPDLTRLLAITCQYAPEDIYNMDETGLFYALPPDKELAEGQGEEAQKLKARLTIVLATNADGSDRHPLLFIGKTEETITDPEAGIEYRQNVKGTMTPLIFQQWLTSWNVRLANSDRRPVLLLIDDSSTHKLPTGSPLSHIRIESTGTISQPIMLGVVQSFKAHYRRRSTGRAISRVKQLPASEIYAIDPITAMRLCRSAWNAVSIQTVLNAWTASGLVGHHAFGSLNEQVSRSGCEASEHVIHVSQPTPEASGSVRQISEPVIQVSGSVLQVSQPDEQASESIPQASKPVTQQSRTSSEACEPIIQVSEPPALLSELTPLDSRTEISKDIQVLQNLSALTPQNAMSVSELLNPPNESNTDPSLWTPEQIYNHMRKPRSPKRINQTTSPSIEKVQEAVKTLQSYLEIDDSKEGQELETSLEAFGRRLIPKNSIINNNKSKRSITKGQEKVIEEVEIDQDIEEQDKNDQALITNFFELAQR